jgi:FkbM family methyltransferase
MRAPGAGKGALLRTLYRLEAHRALRALGVRVDRYTPHLARRALIDAERVDVVIDVGANTGQYAEQLRAHGYRGRIVSFEPLSAAFSVLAEAAASADGWVCRRLALGAVDGHVPINVAANSQSSSLLAILDRHTSALRGSSTVATEDVPVARLDSVAASHVTPSERLMLKLDVQGFEDRVLEGASRTLERVRVVECELSLVPLYEGQALITDLLQSLAATGFVLVELFDGFRDESTDELLQVEGFFVRHH